MPNEQRKPYSISVVTPPASEPLSKPDVWSYLRVDDPEVQSEEDSLIIELIQAAREQVEMYTRRTFMPTTFDMFMDRFPDPYDVRNPFVFFKDNPFKILLPRSPLISVTWVKYYDTSNVLQTLVSGTDYQLDLTSEPVRIDPYPETVWPQTFLTRYNAVNIRFVAGYGVDATHTPARAKIAMKMLVADMYENREQGIVGAPKMDNKTYDRLLNGISLWEF